MGSARGTLFGAAATSIVALLAAAACSSFGTADDSSPPSEAGAPDGTLAASDGGADATPPPRCANPLGAGSFGDYLKAQAGGGDVAIDGASVHATATLAAGAASTATANVEHDIVSTVSSLVLDYDLSLPKHDVHVEVGCLVQLTPNASGDLPRTEVYPVAEPGEGMYLRVDDFAPDGGYGGLVSGPALAPIPETPTRVHLDVDLAKTPGRLLGSFAIGAKSVAIDVPVEGAPQKVIFHCGLLFARGTPDGGALDVSVSNVQLSICP